MKKFALIWAAWYIAPRHMKAISETWNIIVAALDKSDSVGIIDSYFPDADFFTEFERFDRHIDKLRREKNQKIDYVSICSPNYLHDAHIRFALRNWAHAICEKPLVLNPWNLEALQKIENENDSKIYTILQLRLHPSIIALKKQIEEWPKDKIYDIDLCYITSRWNWYLNSWKWDITKSWWVATNIWIHFFDMLSWVFGKASENILHISEEKKVAGFLKLEKANVRWVLSLDSKDLPKQAIDKNLKTYRSISIEWKEIEFSWWFTDLHTQSYQKILEWNGYGLQDAKDSIDIAYNIRNWKTIWLKWNYHPYAKNF